MHGQTVAELPVKPLADGAPLYNRPLKRPEYQTDLQTLDLKSVKEPSDYNDVLLKLLDSPTIASKRWIYRQYDHMVRTNTVVLPGSDAAVIRVKGTTKGLAMTTDCNSRYCYLDPYTGGMIAVAEAARNIVCSGGKPMAITDCLNFGNPEKPEIMWQFQQATLGLSKACEILVTPVIGGNVSLYNETQGVAIYPTPTVGMVGLLEDVDHHCTSWFKDDGDVILLLGLNKEEIGGSEYLKIIHDLEKGMPPAIDLTLEKAVQDTCLNGIQDKLVKSAHDCSEGGLAVALAECCFTGGGHMIGAKIEIPLDIRKDAFLFGESQSRIVVTLAEENVDEFNKIATRYNAPVVLIGRVGGGNLSINNLINLPVSEMEKAWSEAIPRRLEQ
jgi:phosphoribosylformylglycinamidine synthase